MWCCTCVCNFYTCRNTETARRAQPAIMQCEYSRGSLANHAACGPEQPLAQQLVLKLWSAPAGHGTNQAPVK